VFRLRDGVDCVRLWIREKALRELRGQTSFVISLVTLDHSPVQKATLPLRKTNVKENHHYDDDLDSWFAKLDARCRLCHNRIETVRVRRRQKVWFPQLID
jgi:hypothetical protein